LATSSAQFTSEFSNPNLEVLISEEQIQTRIRELGAEITRDYAGLNPLLIGVLKGACTFLSDLMRASDIQLGVEFMAISSYGASTRTSGEVRIMKDLDVPIEGRHILVVEDIVDTGLTLSYLLSSLASRGAASVKLAALLDKYERRQKEVKIDYLGFKIPDEFVVGYGLDFAERYRNLPFIAVLKNPEA
jgi:hypoxanthine phosphoribosyltransferase